MKASTKELKVLVIFAAMLVVVLLGRHSAGSLYVPPVEYGAKNPDSIRFSIAGDYGATLHTRAVLNQIKAAHPDFHIAVGDFSYSQTGNEREWCSFVTSAIGNKIPFQLISGNHESKDGDDGFIDYFKQCLPDKLDSVGDYGKQYYFDYPARGTDGKVPLMRAILVTPNLTFEEDGSKNDYNTPRSDEYIWLRMAIRSARVQGIPWVAVVMHETCFSASLKSCQVGEGLMRMLIDEKVDLILQGHAHTYERTHQLMCVDPENATCVITSPYSVYQKGKGPVQVITGVGGYGFHDIMTKGRWAPFFAALSGKNKNPAYGVSIIDADKKSLRLHFQSVGKDNFRDNFSIVKGE